MFFNLYQNANQYLNLGQVRVQQAMMAESGGDLQSTAQLYDEALRNITYSMQLAWQSGTLVPDHVYYILAWANFHGGRVRVAFGWGTAAMFYFFQALQAINHAIAMNPQVPHYHSLAGIILLMQGNIVGAEFAFERANQMNPMDSYTSWILAFIHRMRGSQTQAQNFSFAAHNANPALPPIPERVSLPIKCPLRTTHASILRRTKYASSKLRSTFVHFYLSTPSNSKFFGMVTPK